MHREWEQGGEGQRLCKGGGPGQRALSGLHLLLVEREQSILHDWSLIGMCYVMNPAARCGKLLKNEAQFCNFPMAAFRHASLPCMVSNGKGMCIFLQIHVIMSALYTKYCSVIIFPTLVFFLYQWKVSPGMENFG